MRDVVVEFLNVFRSLVNVCEGFRRRDVTRQFPELLPF